MRWWTLLQKDLKKSAETVDFFVMICYNLCVIYLKAVKENSSL